MWCDFPLEICIPEKGIVAEITGTWERIGSVVITYLFAEIVFEKKFTEHKF